MKQILILLLGYFLLLLISPSLLAADYFWFRTYTEAWKGKGKTDFLDGRLPGSVLDSLDSIYKNSPQYYTFYEEKGRLFVQVNCTFDLYEIQGDSLLKKYHNYNRGYTCRSQSFTRNGTHYLLGGQGFWTLHMDLLSLNELNGSWELEITKKQPKDYFSFFIYQNTLGVIALFGEFINNRYDLDEKNPNGYFLDWETKEWKEIEVEIVGLDLNKLLDKGLIHFIQTKDYAFWASTNNLQNIGWNLIDKESGKIYYFSSRNVDMEIAPYLQVIGNVLTYPAPNGQMMTLDLDQVRAQSKEVGFVKIKEESIFQSNILLYLFFLLLGSGLVGLWVRKSLLKRKKVKPELSENLALLQKLLSYSGQCLSTEALDSLLGIDEKVNFDSRRMKRARLIKEINRRYLEQAGKELIVREKNSEDRRFIRYTIQA